MNKLGVDHNCMKHSLDGPSHHLMPGGDIHKAALFAGDAAKQAAVTGENRYQITDVRYQTEALKVVV